MPSYSKNEVVLVRYPFSDLSDPPPDFKEFL